MILKSFKRFNEAFGPSINVIKPSQQSTGTIYLRNKIQKELWDKVLQPKIDTIFNNSSPTVLNFDFHFWKNLTSDIDESNPRVSKETTCGSGNFNFSSRRVLNYVEKELLDIAQSLEPEYNQRNLITDLNDISDISRTAAHYNNDKTKKIKNRILTGFDDKDINRIKDIVKKSQKPDKNGNIPTHVEQIRRQKTLANTMAKAIDDGAKALRRAKAAESIGENDLASIFYGRSADLKFGPHWRGSTTLRELNKKLNIFGDDDFDLSDPDQD